MAYIIIFVFFAAVFAVMLILVFSFKKYREKYWNELEIDQEQSVAYKKEDDRQARKPIGESPMPRGKYYSKGELGLLNPIKTELDDELKKLCNEFRKLSETERTNFRNRMKQDEFYTLLRFAERSCVFALREYNERLVLDALTAISIIDIKVIDLEDLSISAYLTRYTLERMEMDVREEFSEAELLAEPSMAHSLTFYSTIDPTLLGVAGFSHKEITTKFGIGFIRHGCKKYYPKTDMLNAAIETSEAINKDKYDIVYIELASEIPAIWLTQAHSPDLTKYLDDIIAGVKIPARLDEGYDAYAGFQEFVVYIVEFENAASAEGLLKISRLKKPEGHTHTGIASGKLFCLLVARSFRVGVESFEKDGALDRFKPEIQKILDKYSAT